MQKWIFDIRSRTFFLLLVAFFILVYLVNAKVLLSSDTDFEKLMQKLAGNMTFDLFMQLFSELGWVLYPIFVAIVLFIRKNTRRLGLILLLSLLIGTIVAAYMRCYTGYEKPDLQYHGAQFALKSGADVSIPCDVDGTFPAGHTVRTTILAFIVGYALSRRFPRGCHLAWIYPIFVSMSRLYLLQEYPSTAIGGAILGILLADIMSKKLKLEFIHDKSKT